MHDDNCFLIIPASGTGSRMNTDTPKQYLKLENGSTILDQSLKTLLDMSTLISSAPTTQTFPICLPTTAA